MKTIKKYRAYIRTILFSIIAAFIIDSAVNFDDIRSYFNEGRGKVTVITHAAKDSIFKLPQRVAIFSGSLYNLIFD
ncbi:hypothetical protein ACTHGU_21700 [Chitinophagaceae bacterium MMS25-I14]